MKDEIHVGPVDLQRIDYKRFFCDDRTDAHPDVHSASDFYARRFESRAGRWFVDVQTDILMNLMAPWRGADVLDVGGGHGQVAGPLDAAGHRVTLLASALDGVGFASPAARHVVIGDLQDPPGARSAYDVVTSLRIMAHIPDWRAFIGGLCRSAKDAVIIDFATPGNANVLAPVLFAAKRRIEGNTRRFNTMTKAEVRAEFRRHGFEVDAEVGQYVLPMLVHRMLDWPRLSRTLEAVPRRLGLDRVLGTPVLMRARRI